MHRIKEDEKISPDNGYADRQQLARPENNKISLAMVFSEHIVQS